MTNILRFDEIGMNDLAQVGGKNASLGEMVSHLASAGIRVPPGFATTADAFERFLAEGELDARIRAAVEGIDIDDVAALTHLGARVRAWIEEQPFPADLEADIRSAYAALVAGESDPTAVTWAVRSSATAEDLPDASFAGQQETFLNIGGIENILSAIRRVFASLYNDRAMSDDKESVVCATDLVTSLRGISGLANRGGIVFHALRVIDSVVRRRWRWRRVGVA